MIKVFDCLFSSILFLFDGYGDCWVYFYVRFGYKFFMIRLYEIKMLLEGMDSCLSYFLVILVFF